MITAPDAPAPAAGEWLEPVYAPWKGNGSDMARDIERKAVTVNQWRYRGFVPDDAREIIIAKAAARGFSLTHRDFIHPDHRLPDEQ